MQRIDQLLAAIFDTHVWVWCAAGDERASRLVGFQGQVVVSAISVWEVAMLESRGRLQLEPDAQTWIASNLQPPVSLEPISAEIAVTSCQLPEFHGDPADRLIVATGITLGIPLITADKKIQEWNDRFRMLQVIEP